MCFFGARRIGRPSRHLFQRANGARSRSACDSIAQEARRPDDPSVLLENRGDGGERVVCTRRLVGNLDDAGRIDPDPSAADDVKT